MEKQLLNIFQREVERQCKFALIANQDIQKALEVGDTDRVWFSIQAFLGAAGNISKLLWPSNPQIPDRAEELKDSLNVAEYSPIAPSVMSTLNLSGLKNENLAIKSKFKKPDRFNPIFYC